MRPRFTAADDGYIVNATRIFSFLKRRLRSVVLCTVGGVGLGTGYLLVTPPQYTAHANIMIENQGGRGAQLLATGGSRPIDSDLIDSQVEVIRSEEIAEAVVRKLALSDRSEFTKKAFSWVKGGRQEESAGEAADRENVDRAITTTLRNLNVRRIDRTYVLQLSFTSIDRELAATVANTFAEAYLDKQLSSRFDASRRAAGWLQERLEELRSQSSSADLAVQKFRDENDLTSADGKLLSEQQLRQLNEQLSVARAETAKAEAKYNDIKNIVDGQRFDSIVAQALDSASILELRNRYLNTAEQATALTQKLGEDHAQVLNLKRRMAEYERLIFGELARMASGYQSDLTVARGRQAALEQELSRLTGITAATNRSLVRLRQLEQQADIYRNLFQTYLQRYNETIQEETLPVSDARIIAAAVAPPNASHPRKSTTMAVSLVFGLLGGVAFGMVRESLDGTFRTSLQVRALGLEFFGVLPNVPGRKSPTSRRHKHLAGRARIIEKIGPQMSYSLRYPLSKFAETLRAIKLATDAGPDRVRSKIIGVVSALPDEGKSTVAKNLATVLALQSHKVLLIDADVRNPGLSRTIAPTAEVGLIQALQKGELAPEMVWQEPESGLWMLPIASGDPLTQSSELLGGSGMQSVITSASRTFDYVIFDLAPIQAVVDARTMAPLVDAFLLVIAWGRTSRATVSHTLATEPLVTKKLLGAVLNNVDMNELSKYPDEGSSSTYNSIISKYYRQAA